MKYNHLTIEEREKILAGLWQKRSIRDMARELNRSPSSISRELEKNFHKEHRRYTPRLAHDRAKTIRHQRNKKPRLRNDFTRQYVEAKLQLRWSPEQIAGRLKLDHPAYYVSHEAIYQYIYSQWHREGYGSLIGKDLIKYLRRRHRRRKRKYLLFKSETGLIKGRIGIERRPAYIEKRIQPGHWEGDSMVSKQSLARLNTLVERKLGLTMITKLADGTKDETSQKVVRRLEVLPPSLRRTLTLDNGHENAGHTEITEALGTKCYFANPYHSWERGSNENTNGLIRQYLPKGTDFANVPEDEIADIENALNTRPRKRLGYRTPLEALNDVLH